MSNKLKLTKEAKKELKAFASKLPAFARTYTDPKRLGQVMFITTRKPGSQIISEGTTFLANGEKVYPIKYYDVPAEAVMWDPYDFLEKHIEKQKEFTNNSIAEAVDEFWKQWEISNEAVKALNKSAGGNNKP